MDLKKVFFELADEMDRHYVAPHIPQILYLSPEDHQEFEIALNELQNSSYTASYKSKGSSGEAWNSPTTEAIHLTIALYSWSIMKAEKSSLIWKAVIGK